MVNKQKSVLWVLLIFLMMSCGQVDSHLSWKDYQEWVYDESNDLRKTKKINDINISVQYVPADYLAYREMLTEASQFEQANFSTHKVNYQCGLTFRIQLEPDKKGVNLLYHQVSNESEYKQRVNALNFRTEEYTSMRIGDNTYSPVLTNYEGYNEILNRLIFTVVFHPEEFECGVFTAEVDEFTFTFEDPFWGMGVNHFTYGASSIMEVPQIILN